MGVIGYGYWGPNIVRNFAKSDKTRVKIICDLNPHSLNRARKKIANFVLLNLSNALYEKSDVIIPIKT